MGQRRTHLTAPEHQQGPRLHILVWISYSNGLLDVFSRLVLLVVAGADKYAGCKDPG